MHWTLVFKVIKWLVPLFMASVLYHKFFNNPDVSISNFLNSLRNLEWYWMPFLILMSMVNWGIETRKWQYLICKLELQPFRVALKSVLCGVTVAQMFPYRTGEYLGRLAYVRDENKIEAGVLSVIGSFTQLMITLIVGTMAFIILRPFSIQMSFVLSLASLMVLLVLGYFHLPRMQFIQGNKLLMSVRQAFALLGIKDVWRLLGFSLLRYLVFLIPYALLLVHFNLGVRDSIWVAMLSVACIYLLQTISPSFILTDLAVRLSVPAIVLTGQLDSHSGYEYYLPGMIIYLVNILIPMLAGALVLITLRLRT